MLHFFRKYERYIFVVITVVIVISFSFFGTNNIMQRPEVVDIKAFTAVDGSTINRSEIEELVRFLSSDNEDKLLAGGEWGPNFLNDGVIRKDFLETGFAQILASQYSHYLRQDLESKRQKEMKFSTYTHPQAKFISAENIWKIINPDLQIKFTKLQELSNPSNFDGIDARVKLILAQSKFPSPMLRQVLRYQEKQYSWVTPDQNLNRIDLSLFGYHTLDDWFGPSFTRLVAEYILNSAIIAEKKGFSVSSEESLADLLRNAEISFQQNSQNPNLGVTNTAQYFDEQLRRLGIDQSKAVGLWQKVMMFRRLFHSDGTVVLESPAMYAPLQEYSLGTVNGNLYQLPPELKLVDFRDLQKFETYLDLVGRRTAKDKLSLPTEYLSVEEIGKTAPELLQRLFLIQVAKVDKKSLQVKVGVKQAWEWEVADQNWEKIKKQFPEIALKSTKSTEDRYAILNQLDKKSRTKIDTFARESIVEEHPEWINEALDGLTAQKQIVGLKKKGESQIFPGLKDSESPILLLDQYPKTEEKLKKYSADNQNYFKIQVLDKSPGWTILTFSEANKDGTLNKLVDARLEKQYEQVRQKEPKQFQNSDGTWKLFAQVQSQVAERYFAPLLESIKNDYIQNYAPQNKDMPMISDYAASLRLYSHMRNLKDKFSQNPENIDSFIQKSQTTALETNKLSETRPMASQWNVVKSDYKVERKDEKTEIEKDEVFALADNNWSNVFNRPNGEINFFFLKEKKIGNDPTALYEMVMESHKILSNEAQRIFMNRQLEEMEAKKAISLAYMKHEESQLQEEE